MTAFLKFVKAMEKFAKETEYGFVVIISDDSDHIHVFGNDCPVCAHEALGEVIRDKHLKHVEGKVH